jgi:hypothetical protein
MPITIYPLDNRIFFRGNRKHRIPLASARFVSDKYRFVRRAGFGLAGASSSTNRNAFLMPRHRKDTFVFNLKTGDAISLSATDENDVSVSHDALHFACITLFMSITFSPRDPQHGSRWRPRDHLSGGDEGIAR